MTWKDVILITAVSSLFTGTMLTMANIQHDERQEVVQRFNTEDIMCKNCARYVDCTAYTASEDETDSDPTITASMTKVRPGIIAVSRDLFDQGFVFGKKVYIEGLGIYTVMDLMNKRYINRIDVFLGNKKEAFAFGKKAVKISLLEID